MPSPILQIPRVQPPSGSGWGDIRQALASGLVQRLGQPWRDQPETAFAPGCVWLGLHESTLLIHAELADREPANRATVPNERTWELGDVLELFLKAEASDTGTGSSAYYEFHITPENRRLQLRFPATAALRDIREKRATLDSFMIADSLFESRTEISRGRDAWQVYARFDLRPLFPDPAGIPSGLRFLISRYDYQPGAARPVLSCNESSRLARPDFHHIPGWTQAVPES
ncbi:hypothetical protein OPIT5_23975 [Opitutaceae bacterium TAV5]|nr:hypothetical protein OPIT5_23975 [Opitutaceae bacterium TAV5]